MSNSRLTRTTRVAVIGLALVSTLGACSGSAAVDGDADEVSATAVPASAPATTAAATTATTVAAVEAPVTAEAASDAVAAGNGWGGRAADQRQRAETVEPGVAPTDEEIEGLLWMREEEKLARDVYQTLYEQWGADIFDRIAASEQRHTDAIAGLLTAYAVEDPVVDDTIGVFSSPELQELYDDLVGRGSASLVDALGVGALIEDLDIVDLWSFLEGTDNPDIERVYANLLSGSENHMRAFVAQLEANGAGYEPIYMDAAELEDILAAEAAGNRNGRSGGRRGNRA